MRTDDLAAAPIVGLLNSLPDFDPTAIDEVVLGCANQAGEDNRNVARMAALLAGLPETVPGITVNRLCASGLDAVSAAARAIKSGDIDVAIAGGVESMSRAPFVMGKAGRAFDRGSKIYDTTIGWRFVNPKFHAAWGTESMPETAENVAAEYGVSRVDQDAFAAQSQTRADLAAACGRLAREVTPVTAPDGRRGTHLVEVDEHPRPDVTMVSLGKLKGVVRADGSVTAGNSSGVNDGAAALLLASSSAVKTHRLTPIARVDSALAMGVAPRVMGYGPVPAIQTILARRGLELDKFARIEINEAFAAQALACLQGLELSAKDPRINPHGGAIALGHPLGMSGARLVGSIAMDLQNASDYGLASMCVGVGQGSTMILQGV
jgi:3-oxoadipyl-CoA thiolase